MEIRRLRERQGEIGIFLVLRNGEKYFARYVNIFVELISNCCMKILPALLTLLY